MEFGNLILMNFPRLYVVETQGVLVASPPESWDFYDCLVIYYKQIKFWVGQYLRGVMGNQSL